MRMRGAGAVSVAAAAVLVAIGLTGCAAQAPVVRLAGGTTSCVPDAAAKPGIMAVAFHNTTGGAISVTGASIAGTNVETADVWVLDGTSAQRTEVDYGIEPFSTLNRWSTRQKVGSVTIAAGKWASIAVSFTFHGGSVEGAEVTGITMKYRAANGATGTAESTASGAYSTEC